MKVRSNLLWVAFVTTFFAACGQTDFKKTKEGFTYKVFSTGSGEKIVPGNYVSVHRTIKIRDSVLQTTYGSAPQILPIPKDTSMKGNDLVNMLLGAKKGDSLQINQPVDSIIRQNPQAGQDPFLTRNKGQNFVYYFKIVDVYKTEEEAVGAMEKESIESFNKEPSITTQRRKDEAELDAYLKSHNIQTQRTPWGAYLQIINPGSGPKPKYGQFAMLKYSGKDLAGNVFDATEKHGGQLLPLQIGTHRSIPGFEDGVKQLSKGAKAVIYIPSVIGYGQQGSPPAIQPNQNLLFEVELVDITDQRPLPPTTPMPDSTRK